MSKRLRDDEINEENAIITNFLRSNDKLYNTMNICKMIDSQQEFNFIIDNTTNDPNELKLLKSVYKYFHELYVIFCSNKELNFNKTYDNDGDDFYVKHISYIGLILNDNLYIEIIFDYMKKLITRLEIYLKVNYIPIHLEEIYYDKKIIYITLDIIEIIR